MLKNKNFFGSVDSNPYNFRHYNLSNFVLYVKGKQIPIEGLSLNFGHEKTSVVAYRTIFKGSGIHHSNASIQITHDMFFIGYFMLLFDLNLIKPLPKVTYHLRPTVRYVWTLNSPKLYLKLLIVCCTWSTIVRYVLTQIEPFPQTISNNGHSTDYMHTS
jgi:hypothetical protein